MANLKFSQIASAPAAPALTDSVVGVSGGGTDYRYTLAQIASTVSPPAGRTKLSANTTYNVSSSGSDSNDGSLSRPWATLQHADNVISSTIDLNGFTATVNIVAGTYVGIENNGGYFSSLAGALVGYAGDTVTPTNVRITGTATHQVCWAQFAANTGGGGSSVGFDGVDLHPGGNSALWVDNEFVGSAEAGNVTVGFLSGSSKVSSGASTATFSGNCTIEGGSSLLFAGAGLAVAALMDDGHARATNHIIFLDGSVTITGTPTFNNAAVFLQNIGTVRMLGSLSGAYTGSAFGVQGHSKLAGPNYHGANWGTPSALSFIITGGLYTDGLNALEATGGQVIPSNANHLVPLTGFSLALGDYDGMVIIEPAGTLATGTITLLTNPLDQTRVNIRTTQTITNLTLSSSKTIAPTLTTIAAGHMIDAFYNDSTSTWYVAT